MKAIITTALVLLATVTFAQNKPKQHIFYDTVQQVKKRVDYSPDTIPVYFKELEITHVTVIDLYYYNTHSKGRDTLDVIEKWNAGFVIWQTYRKQPGWENLTVNTSVYALSSGPEYYKDEYEPSRLADGKFLYADKKPVTNKVIFSIKR